MHNCFRTILGGLTATFLTTALQAQQTDVPNPDETVGVIRMSDLGSNEVLDMMERFTGKPILRQQSLPTVKINFSSQGPMTKAEAVLALESLLSLNGIAITDVGEKFLKAVPSAAIGTQVPPMIEKTTLDAIPSQKIYAKFFRLNYLQVAEALPLLQPMLTQGTPVAFDKSNSLMIVDALINLQRIEKILLKIDVPAPLDTAIYFFTMKHVTASEIVTRLTAMQQGSLRRYFENNTTFDADDRTNQVIVVTHHSNKTIITDLIDKLDIDVAPLTQTEVFRLKHADAEEVVSLVEQVITGQQQARESQAGTPQTTRRQQPAQQQQQARTNKVAAAVAASEENLQFSEYMRIVADPRANAIVAYGTHGDLKALKELVDKIDVLLAQVRIEVVIAEVSLSKDLVRGIDAFNFSYNALQSSGDDDTTPTGSANQFVYSVTPSGSSIGSKTIFDIARGTIDPFSIAAVINKARQNNLVKVLSAPTIMTTHNQEATINVGEARPVITSSQSSLASQGFARSTVQFRDIGIELKVKPLIGANGVVQMEIEQKVESVVGEISVDGNQQPIIGTRNATSFISVRDGELVVLGGLQSIDETESKSRLALFGSIPLLGSLFGSKSIVLTKTELLIFIQPHVLTTSQEANEDAGKQIDLLQSNEEVLHYLEKGTFKPKEDEEELKSFLKPKKKKDK